MNSLFQVLQLSAAQPDGDAALLQQTVLPCALCFGKAAGLAQG